MKISKLGQWCAEYFFIFFIIGFFCLVAVMGTAVNSANNILLQGTDVIVKGTELHGTVTHIYGNDDVEVTFVGKGGFTTTERYNRYLLIKQAK